MRVHRDCVRHDGRQRSSDPLVLVLVAGGPGQVGTEVWREDVSDVLQLLQPGDCVVTYDHRGTAPATELVSRDSRDWIAALSSGGASYAQRRLLTSGLAADLDRLGRQLVRPHVRLVAWGASYGGLVAHTAAQIPRSPFAHVVLDSPTVVGSARYASDADALFWAACAASDHCGGVLPEGRAVLDALLEDRAGNGCLRATDLKATLRHVAHTSPTDLPALLVSLRDCPSVRRHVRLLRRLGVFRVSPFSSERQNAHRSRTTQSSSDRHASHGHRHHSGASNDRPLAADAYVPDWPSQLRHHLPMRSIFCHSRNSLDTQPSGFDSGLSSDTASSRDSGSSGNVSPHSIRRRSGSRLDGGYPLRVSLESGHSPQLVFRRSAHRHHGEADAHHNSEVHAFANALVTCTDLMRFPTAESEAGYRFCESARPSLVDNCASLAHYSAHVCPSIVAAGLQPSVPSDRGRLPPDAPPATLLLGGLDLVTGALPAARHYSGARRVFLLKRSGHVVLPGGPCISRILNALRSGDWAAVRSCVSSEARRPVRWALD